MVTTVDGLVAPSPTDALYSVAGTVTQLRDALATRLSDTGWVTVPAAWYGTGWSAFTNADWAGFKYRVRLGFVFMAGAVTKNTAVTTNDTVLTLPAAYRPTTTWQTMCDDSFSATRGAKPVIVRADGKVILTNGSAQQTFSMSLLYPV